MWSELPQWFGKIKVQNILGYRFWKVCGLVKSQRKQWSSDRLSTSCGSAMPTSTLLDNTTCHWRSFSGKHSVVNVSNQPCDCVILLCKEPFASPKWSAWISTKCLKWCHLSQLGMRTTRRLLILISAEAIIADGNVGGRFPQANMKDNIWAAFIFIFLPTVYWGTERLSYFFKNGLIISLADYWSWYLHFPNYHIGVSFVRLLIK